MFWNRRRKPAEALPTGDKGVTTELWSRKAAEMVENQDWSRNLWQSHPITQDHIQRAMTGDAAVNWLNFFHRRYCTAPFEFGISLGCGNGAAERDSINLGICREIDGYELSPGAVQVAREQARIAGISDKIHYHIADLDSPQLPVAKYDVAIAGQSVHHVTNLEALVQALHRSMKPTGYLILNEYVGPSRYQWTDKTDRLMNDLLQILPPEKRRKQDGTLKEAVVRPLPEHVIAVDPSESVRSADILPVFSQWFETDYHANFGGTLLQHLLSEIVANFHEDDSRDRAIIDLLVHYEATLIEEGIIESDFVFAIMKPRLQPVG